MINGNTFLELFKSQVSARGNKPALNDPTAGRQMTYAELDEYAGRVAAKMRENGVVHGDSVALVMPNSLNEAADLMRRLAKPGDTVLFENDLPDNYSET